MPLSLADFVASENGELEPTTVEHITVGRQYVLKTSDDYRPEIQILQAPPGKKLYCVVTKVWEHEETGEPVAEVELLGPKDDIDRAATHPPLTALGDICLATTSLLNHVPGSKLTAVPDTFVFNSRELAIRRENLEVMNVGVAALCGHIPFLVNAKRAREDALRRRHELDMGPESEGAGAPGKGTRRSLGGLPISGSKGSKRSRGGDEEDEEGGDSGSEALESGKDVDSKKRGSGRKPPRPSRSQVSGGSAGGIKLFDDVLDRAAEERKEQGVAGHLVFTQTLDLQVEEGVSVPLAVMDTRCRLPSLLSCYCVQELWEQVWQFLFVCRNLSLCFSFCDLQG